MTLADSLFHCLTRWQAGEHAEAERIGRELLVAHPRHPAVLALLALALHGRGEDAAALDAVRRAMAVSTLSADLYHNAGVILTALGRLDEALPCFHQAVVLAPALRPDPPTAHWRDCGGGVLELDPGFTPDAAYAAAARPLPPRLPPPSAGRG